MFSWWLLKICSLLGALEGRPLWTRLPRPLVSSWVPPMGGTARLEGSQVSSLLLDHLESESLLKFCALGSSLAPLNSNTEEEIRNPIWVQERLPRAGDNSLMTNMGPTKRYPEFLMPSPLPWLCGELYQRSWLRKQKWEVKKIQPNSTNRSDLIWKLPWIKQFIWSLHMQHCYMQIACK